MLVAHTGKMRQHLEIMRRQPIEHKELVHSISFPASLARRSLFGFASLAMSFIVVNFDANVFGNVDVDLVERFISNLNIAIRWVKCLVPTDSYLYSQAAQLQEHIERGHTHDVFLFVHEVSTRFSLEDEKNAMFATQLESLFRLCLHFCGDVLHDITKNGTHTQISCLTRKVLEFSKLLHKVFDLETKEELERETKPNTINEKIISGSETYSNFSGTVKCDKPLYLSNRVKLFGRFRYEDISTPSSGALITEDDELVNAIKQTFVFKRFSKVEEGVYVFAAGRCPKIKNFLKRRNI